MSRRSGRRTAGRSPARLGYDDSWGGGASPPTRLVHSRALMSDEEDDGGDASRTRTRRTRTKTTTTTTTTTTTARNRGSGNADEENDAQFGGSDEEEEDDVGVDGNDASDDGDDGDDAAADGEDAADDNAPRSDIAAVASGFSAVAGEGVVQAFGVGFAVSAAVLAAVVAVICLFWLAPELPSTLKLFTMGWSKHTFNAPKGVAGQVAYAYPVSLTLPAIGRLRLFGHNINDEPAKEALALDAIAYNVVLLLAVGVQHTLMARKSFSNIIARVYPAHLLRSLYVFTSAVAVWFLVENWKPVGSSKTALWDFPKADNAGNMNVYAMLMWLLFAAGATLVAAGVASLDILSFLGIRQALGGTAEAPYNRSFVRGVARHPVANGIMLMVWATPTATIGHVLFATLTSAYLYLNFELEDRDLAEEFGDDFAEYKSDTPWHIFPTGESLVDDDDEAEEDEE
eukprot:m.485703 g.485703  ORF g.485703 m.485703 type:complete len:456 (+) comp23937_c0_seq1:105-1472(+)